LASEIIASERVRRSSCEAARRSVARTSVSSASWSQSPSKPSAITQLSLTSSGAFERAASGSSSAPRMASKVGVDRALRQTCERDHRLRA
jgi:hypothetical protein